MRYRKKSILKHKKHKLLVKKSIKRVLKKVKKFKTFNQDLNRIIADNGALYRVAMHNKYKCCATEKKLNITTEELKVAASRCITLEALLMIMLSEYPEGIEIKNNDFVNAIVAIQEEKIGLNVQHYEESKHIQAVEIKRVNPEDSKEVIK